MEDYRIGECLEAEGNAPDGLFDDWALEFLESLKKWDREFTDKQENKLAELYKKACDSDY